MQQFLSLGDSLAELKLLMESFHTQPTKGLQSSPSLPFFPGNPRKRGFPSKVLLRIFTVHSGSTGNSNGENQSQRINNAGMRLEETVEAKLGKLRLDSWISSRISGISRARIQSSIKSRLVSVNGRVVDKVSHNVKAGDKVSCTISELQPLRAEPEDIPLEIVYEDEHLLVVNKPPHMVVHPAPGNPSGTLVNGILHHCSLPTVATSSLEVLSDMEDISDDEGSHSTLCGASVRPGIVHRLDKGTSGLLVVAKDEHAHAHLSEQFQQHTIQRIYISLTSGVPSASMGRIDIPIGRDVNNRIRMTAIPGPIKQGQARHAASRYKVIEILAGGGSALVEWRLETGRTHQIRAHAKYIGIPLLGDEVYGGTKSLALSRLRPRIPPSCLSQLSLLLSGLERPCLHALALGIVFSALYFVGSRIHTQGKKYTFLVHLLQILLGS
ncbi:RNA pseudouridine synthase 2, chloroplastic isoform X3 [Hevea brasiliensis]|uniref:RNA pseudouridine synthase 2, chloroplastic isoform X3 n=1 Tax=Hevea brasiliensis TaxID=3981 RepID=UPI0025CEC0C2|nr:RNA pseudouridine synthase 2, chloroplastic isoform X3 [Hevea brasiliensis]